jgi:hypothetical protein
MFEAAIENEASCTLTMLSIVGNDIADIKVMNRRPVPQSTGFGTHRHVFFSVLDLRQISRCRTGKKRTEEDFEKV